MSNTIFVCIETLKSQNLFTFLRIIRFEDFIRDNQKVVKDLEEFVGLKVSNEMKSFLAEKKIGPTPTKVEVNVNQPNKVQQRFAPIQDPKKPEIDPKKPKNDPEETRIIPAFEWQRHLSGLCKSSAIM